MALFFWSKIGSGFGGPGGTPPPTIPWSTPPPPPTSLRALSYSWNKVTAWSLTSLSAIRSCTKTQVACVAGVFLFFYFVVRKVRGTEPHICWTEVEKENDSFSLCVLPSPGSSPIVFVLGSAFARLTAGGLRTAIQTKKPTKTYTGWHQRVSCFTSLCVLTWHTTLQNLSSGLVTKVRCNCQHGGHADSRIFSISC